MTTCLTQTAYHLWLMAQPHDQVLDVKPGGYGLTVRTWMAATLPRGCVAMWPRVWEDRAGRQQALPPWAQRQIDRLHGPSTPRIITVAVALAALEAETD